MTPLLPSDVSACGLMLDPEHAEHVGALLRLCKNTEAIGLLAAWRRSVATLPFVIAAGRLDREHAGVVGGMAASWPDALALHRFAVKRLDDLAKRHGRFTSAWVLLLTDERTASVRASITTGQPTHGTA